MLGVPVDARFLLKLGVSKDLVSMDDECLWMLNLYECLSLYECLASLNTVDAGCLWTLYFYR